VGVYIAFNALRFALIMPERPRPCGNAFIFEMQTLTVITLHFDLSLFHLSLSPSAGNFQYFSTDGDSFSSKRCHSTQRPTRRRRNVTVVVKGYMIVCVCVCVCVRVYGFDSPGCRQETFAGCSVHGNENYSAICDSDSSKGVLPLFVATRHSV
jgi:hypothetical protein